ncbi:hypothetical protein AGMMS50276_29580 [Synergistales bacterium]|nr:hypothetical protein AGMMS50276_29580 [Synergistales bacterium]
MPDENTGVTTEQGTEQEQAQQGTSADTGADVSLLAGAKGEDVAGDAKTEETAEAVKVEDFTIPDGKVFDEELSKSYLDIVNDSTLSKKDLARKLVDLYGSLEDKRQEAERQEYEKYAAEIKGWEQAAKADKEYGGQNWEKSSAVIAAGRDKVASPELVAWIEENKFGNHPELLRMFYRAGKLTGEDRAAGTLAAAKVDPAEAIFGESLRGSRGGK